MCDGALMQRRVLRDDGDGVAQPIEAERANVDAIDLDRAGRGLDEAEEGEDEGRLAATRTPYDAAALPAWDVRTQPAERKGQLWPVAHLERLGEGEGEGGGWGWGSG